MQGTKHNIPGVTAEIPHNAAAKRPPAPPTRRQITGVIRTHLRRPQPQVPIQTLGHRRVVMRARLRPIAAIKPDMRLANLPEYTAPSQFDGAAQFAIGGPL